MVTITARAMATLEDKLKNQTANPQLAFRMVVLSLLPVRVCLYLDREGQCDLVFERPDGRKVLFIHQDIARHLGNMTVDHQPETKSQG